MDLETLLFKHADAALTANHYGTPRVLADERVASLTPTDLLGIIADCVSRLPTEKEVPSALPGLELGRTAEAYALIGGMADDAGMEGFREKDYACVHIGGLWVGASRPKTGGAT